MSTQRGLYNVDFQCNELDQVVTVFGVKAYDSEDAEKRAKVSLSPSLTWQCTGIDRTGDAK